MSAGPTPSLCTGAFSDLSEDHQLARGARGEGQSGLMPASGLLAQNGMAQLPSQHN